LVISSTAAIKTLVADAVADALNVHSSNDLERPLKVSEYAKHQGVDPSVVRGWCEAGMPHYKTGDVRGIRIYPSRAREWLELNRG
jgi:hypothetical protein